MRPLGESRFESSEEVLSVHWLAPQDAVKRLDHEGERVLIAQASRKP
jgi:hypothetical protein